MFSMCLWRVKRKHIYVVDLETINLVFLTDFQAFAKNED